MALCCWRCNRFLSSSAADLARPLAWPAAKQHRAPILTRRRRIVKTLEHKQATNGRLPTAMSCMLSAHIPCQSQVRAARGWRRSPVQGLQTRTLACHRHGAGVTTCPRGVDCKNACAKLLSAQCNLKVGRLHCTEDNMAHCASCAANIFIDGAR